MYRPILNCLQLLSIRAHPSRNKGELMDTLEVKCYSDDSNGVILQTPGRHFPGLVVQGDTLRTLYRKAERAISLLDKGETQEAREYLLDLLESLGDRLAHYESTLARDKIELPYPDPIGNKK